MISLVGLEKTRDCELCGSGVGWLSEEVGGSCSLKVQREELTLGTESGVWKVLSV